MCTNYDWAVYLMALAFPLTALLICLIEWLPDVEMPKAEARYINEVSHTPETWLSGLGKQ